MSTVPVLTDNSDMRSFPAWTVLICIVAGSILGLTGCKDRVSSDVETDLFPWADSVLLNMSLHEKVSQMMMVDVPDPGDILSDEARAKTRTRILNGNAGGVILFSGEPVSYAPWVEWIQQQSVTPSLVGLDAEWGAGYRLSGFTRFPDAMAVAATGVPQIARHVGAQTAREARSVGISVLFAPIADVLTRPSNPVISTRAYSDHPDSVAVYANAFAQGVRSVGSMPVAKHFPGHGDTETDSHYAWPVSERSEDDFWGVDIAPFQSMIANSIEGIMSAHILSLGHAFADSLPATLSPSLMTAVLRDSLKFEGVLFSDALNMAGVTTVGSNEMVAVQAVKAGIDVLLMPPNPERAVQAILQAVDADEISVARIDSSVRRILRAKENLGLATETAHTRIDEILRYSSQDDQTSEALMVARKAVTVLKDRTVLPLSGSTGAILYVSLDFRSYPDSQQDPALRQLDNLRRWNDDKVTHVRVNPRNWAASVAGLLAESSQHRAIIVADFVGTTPVFGWNASRFLDSFNEISKPLIVLEHASPFTAAIVPDNADVLVLGYDRSPAMLEAVADVLFGGAPAQGRLPVQVSEEYPRGYGLELRQSVAQLTRPETASMNDAELDRVNRLINNAIADSAFPGAALAIGRGTDLAFSATFGNHTFTGERPLKDNDLFDLASLTKVIATTTAMMKLVESGTIDLYRPVADYLPEFGQAGKGGVTVYDLLTHSGGLIPFIPFHMQGVRSGSEVRSRILQDSLLYQPGAQVRYSDFGPITLAWMIEKVTGQSFSSYVKENVFEPLSMHETGFLPVRQGPVENAVPTELDDYFRYRLMQGEVHDETAYLLGGTAGHAGLFSTARDLSRFAAMLTNEGRVGDRRFLKPETIRRFVTKVDPELKHTRALGWDTKSPSGYSSAGKRFGPRSFGHTGFTGTSFWIDPDTKMYVILLTNRVYPTRNNRGHIPVRPAVADLAQKAFQPERFTDSE